MYLYRQRLAFIAEIVVGTLWMHAFIAYSTDKLATTVTGRIVLFEHIGIGDHLQNEVLDIQQAQTKCTTH